MPRGARTVLIAIAAAFLLATAWLGFFFYRDNFSGAYPNKFVSAAVLRGGELPLWNFHDSGGQPLGGNPNTLTFYPDTLLYLVLPPHVAFNLHFLLHLVLAFFAMRALCLARGVSSRAALFAATVYVLSGPVISSTSFYNLVVPVALIPLALLAVERRSFAMLGIACGLLGLAAEPVVIFATALAIVIVSLGGAPPLPAASDSRHAAAEGGGAPLRPLVFAAILALLIASPMLIAYFEIASEVERAHGISAQTVLRTSLGWKRVAELFAWPFATDELRLFPSIFIGIIAIPALIQRSRYTLIAAITLLFALGSHNPLLRYAVEHFDAIRVMRYPEKFVLPLTVALAVLIAMYFDRTRFKAEWAIVTLLPLALMAIYTLPLDWYAPYKLAPVAPRRVIVRQAPATDDSRREYRERAARYEPLFGATAGLRYAFVRSSDRMHSYLSRIAYERFVTTRNPRYSQLATGAPAFIVPRVVAAPTLQEAVGRFESTSEHVAPRAFVSAPGRVTSYREEGQRIVIDVESSGPVLLLVNQSYFEAWSSDANLETLPVDIDRLGVIVPKSGRVTLTFGKRRGAIGIAWALSLALLALLPFVEKRDRRAREIQRPADEH